MVTIEQALIDKIRTLDEQRQQRVMEFIETMEKPLSARELMKLPYEERMRRARTALARTAEKDVELFEAYEVLDDE